MVSLQRTARPVSGTLTRKKQACWRGPEGLAGNWRRRDMTNRRTHREQRIHDVEDCGPARGRWPGSNQSVMVGLGDPYTTLSPGLQARIGGNMLGSRPSLVEVLM